MAPNKNQPDQGKASKEASSVASAKTAPPALAKATKTVSLIGRFFREDVDVSKLKVDESDFLPKHKNLVRLVQRQSLVILVLVFLLIGGAVLFQPLYKYYMRWPGTAKKIEPLVALTEPNLTDQAILSWVVTSITEILTFGFGDFDARIIAQHHRFTPEGWDSFVKSIRERNMREDFKMHQLVLATVPSNSPVIVAKGLDEDNDYVWTVELPIVMTYSTNNNRQSGRNSIVRVTVARMPSLENRAGIGIKMWKIM